MRKLVILAIFVAVVAAQGPPQCYQVDQYVTPFCSAIGRPQSDYAVTSYVLGRVSSQYTFSFSGVCNSVITNAEQTTAILRTTLFVNGEQFAATQINLSEITTLPAGPGVVNFGYNDGGYFWTQILLSPPANRQVFWQFQFFDQNGIQLANIRSIVYTVTPPLNDGFEQ